jgi:hypothetical protein
VIAVLCSSSVELECGADQTPASPLDRLDRKVTASVGDETKAGIGEESPTSGNAGVR